MNNKRRNRKGFTIVELSIVIAVIAILAAVMIPVFSNMITKANKSNALQEAKNANTTYISEFDYNNDEGALPEEDYWVKTSKGYYVEIVDGQVTTDEDDITKDAPASCYKLLNTSTNAVAYEAVDECATGDACANKDNH